MTTPRTQFPSPLEVSNANIAPKSNKVHKSSALFTKEIRLDKIPKELDAPELGLENAKLPFLPEVGGENAPMYLTPISSPSLAQLSSPPVLQRSEEYNLHGPSLAMHCGLFVPDDF
jgi:hypothetical protein